MRQHLCIGITGRFIALSDMMSLTRDDLVTSESSNLKSYITIATTTTVAPKVSASAYRARATPYREIRIDPYDLMDRVARACGGDLASLIPYLQVRLYSHS